MSRVVPGAFILDDTEHSVRGIVGDVDGRQYVRIVGVDSSGELHDVRVGEDGSIYVNADVIVGDQINVQGIAGGEPVPISSDSLDDIETDIDSIESKVATETTLAEAEADLDSLVANTSGLQGTLDSVKTDLDSIDTKLATTGLATHELAENTLVASGNIVNTTGDVLTTEKLSGPISIAVDRRAVYVIAIDKPIEDTAGNMTVKVYNVVTVDDSNARNCLLHTYTVAKIAGLGTYQCNLLQGLFIGDGTIQLGITFATASGGAITVYYKIYAM